MHNNFLKLTDSHLVFTKMLRNYQVVQQKGCNSNSVITYYVFC